MNQPHLTKTTSAGGGEVFERDVAHVVGAERVEVENIGDGDLHRLFMHDADSMRY